MLMAAFVLYLVMLMLGLLEIPKLPIRSRSTTPNPVALPDPRPDQQEKRQSEIQRTRKTFHSRFV